MSGSYWDKITRERISRRRLLKAGASLSIGAAALALVGCGDDDDDGGGGDGGTSPTSAPAGSPAAGGPKYGGTARVNLATEEPAHYDVHGAATFGITEPISLAYSTLIKFSSTENGKLVGDLASAWETPDDTTITFTLNEANFHDGTPFTSEDVKATLERIKSPPEGITSVRKAWFEPLESVETPDDRTAVLHLSRPSALLLNAFGTHNIAIYAKKDIDADPKFHETKTNGTGPWKLDRVNQGQLYAFVKNPDYFVQGRPYLDGWEMYWIPEPVARFATFRAGDLDLYNAQTTDVETIQNEMKDATLIIAQGTAYWVMTFATWKEPWGDPRAYKALSLAVNRSDFNEAQFLGTSAWGGPLPPGSSFALTEEELLQVPGYKGLGDGKEASMDERWAESKKLFDAVGVTGKLAIFSWDTASFVTWTEVVLDGIRHVGLDGDLTLVDRGTYDERLQNREFGDLACNSRSAVIPDPTPVFADSYIEGAGRHYSGLIIPEVEDLFVKQESELDPEARFALQNEMQKKFLEVYPAEIGVFTVTNQAYYNYVKDYGVVYGTRYVARKYEDLWLDV